MTGPFLGDIRLCNPDRDKDLRLWELVDFEIWDGQQWVHAQQALNREFAVEKSS